MRIVTCGESLFIDTKEIWCNDSKIYCRVNDNVYEIGRYYGFISHNRKISDYIVGSEVMTSMTDYFDLFPDGVFRMPTQEEIEDRINDGEDDEE